MYIFIDSHCDNQKREMKHQRTTAIRKTPPHRPKLSALAVLNWWPAKGLWYFLRCFGSEFVARGILFFFISHWRISFRMMMCIYNSV